MNHSGHWSSRPQQDPRLWRRVADVVVVGCLTMAMSPAGAGADPASPETAAVRQDTTERLAAGLHTSAGSSTGGPSPTAQATPGSDSLPAAAADGGRQEDPSRAGPLLRLLEASGTGRRRLETKISEANAVVARLEAELQVAREALVASRSSEQGSRTQVAEVEAGLGAVEVEIARLKAEPLTEADAQRTTPVAHPQPKGQTPQDRTARAREDLAAAHGRRWKLAAKLALRQRDLALAEQAVTAADAAVTAKLEEVEQHGAALERLNEQLAQVPGSAGVPGSLARALIAEGEAGPRPSKLALADIPPDYLDRYVRAATMCRGLAWTVLAAVGSVESSHGRLQAPGVHAGANFAGAMGPMQFLGATWDAYGVDGDSDGTRDVYDPDDAVFGAARYLCASGAGNLGRLSDAIWAYNHADWYVEMVLERAAAYGAGIQAATANAAALVQNPNVTLSPAARADLLGGGVDPRVVAALSLAASRHAITVTVIRTGHDELVRGTDRVSNHYLARAVDISSVDGAPVSASNPAALYLALSLLSLDSRLRPAELGSPWPELSQFAGAFTDGDHLAHLHLGWQA